MKRAGRKAYARNPRRGFALLVAVIFMSVMLVLGLILGSLSYKQQILASSAIESQDAFYVADAALECALFSDQKQNEFAYPSPYNPLSSPSAPGLICRYVSPVSSTVLSYTSQEMVTFNRVQIDSGTGSGCADVTVYKPSSSTGTTYIFSQGYNVPCSTVQSASSGVNAGNLFSNARIVARGLSAEYN